MAEPGISFTAKTRVYVDTNMFIAWVERPRRDTQDLQSMFQRLALSGATLFTSEMTVAECLYGATKQGNAAATSAYEKLFASGDVAVVSLGSGVTARAAQSSADLGLKLIDCIHYVTALEQGCDYFFSADKRFKSDEIMQVISP